MRRLLPIVIVPTLLLIGCGSGDDDVATRDEGGATTTTSTTTPTTEPAATEPVEVDVCAELDVAILQQVEDPGPADERPEDAGPSDEELEAAAAEAAALRRIAEGGPEELRADAGAVADLYEAAIEDPEGADEPAVPLGPARQRLLDWGIAGCEVPGPIWGCATPGTFRRVPGRIDLPPEEWPTVEEAGDPRPILSSVDVDPAWEMVEVGRTDHRITFAWLDADGLAVRSATAETTADGWWEDQTTTCQEPVLLEPSDPDGSVPESVPPPRPADEAELPPGSSTSVPD